MEFHAITLENKAKTAEVVDIIKDFLEKNNIRYHIPEAKPEKNLSSSFSLKLAATCSGIGWVGKNSMLVTKEYGPRIRLAAIFVDLDLPINQPISESSCGECKVCVNACPHNCIHNKNWSVGIERDLLFDAIKCKSVGHKNIEYLGCNFSCGICAFSCPIGK